jgi:hypothetical protein
MRRSTTKERLQENAKYFTCEMRLYIVETQRVQGDLSKNMCTKLECAE